MTTELARIEKITSTDLFKPGTIDPVLDAIEAEVRREAACLDISTPENRKALNSLAFKVGKSKTFIEGQRKNLTAEMVKQKADIDREGRRIWVRFEALQDEVRKPLTDWENADKERIARHEVELVSLISLGDLAAREWQVQTLEAMQDTLLRIQTMEYDWQEFLSRAAAAVRVTVSQIKEAIAKRQKYDAEQQELAELRAAEVKRAQEARDAEIARKAKEEADAAAERKAEAARQAADAERQRIEDERVQADARAKEAEARRVEAEEKAENDRLDAIKAEEARAKAAAEKAEKDKTAALADAEAREKSIRQLAKEKAERDRVAAVEAERARVAEDKRKADAETAKREANRKHAAKIKGEVRDALLKVVLPGEYSGLAKADAEEIVKAIAQGLIAHTKISY